MSTLKRQLSVVVVVVALATIGTIMNSRQSVVQGAGGPTVTIDPSQLPLPIKGSITAGGTVAATQSGPWNVGIIGTPSVNVTNTAASPVIVQDTNTPKRTPFSMRFDELGGDFGSVTGPTVSFTVPSNQRLEVEFIACSANTAPATENFGFFLGGDNGRVTLIAHDMVQGSPEAIWAVSERTLLHFAPNEKPFLLAFRSVAGSLWGAGCTISGYTISVP